MPHFSRAKLSHVERVGCSTLGRERVADEDRMSSVGFVQEHVDRLRDTVDGIMYGRKAEFALWRENCAQFDCFRRCRVGNGNPEDAGKVQGAVDLSECVRVLLCFVSSCWGIGIRDIH